MQSINTMNNYERIQKRIERDKIRRASKKSSKNREYNDMNKVFTIEHHNNAMNMCKNGVMWKATAQKYCRNAPYNALKLTDTYKTGDIILPHKIDKQRIRERGKERIITPISFDDRVSQRIICNYSLLPIVADTLISDNCASMPNKGIDFARKRIDEFLHISRKKWGNKYYVLVTDFKNFFGSIPHIKCYNALNKLYDNPAMVNLIMDIVKSYHIADVNNNKNLTSEEKGKCIRDINNLKGHGLCLGSQISQLLALLVPNEIDHYIKNNQSVQMYLRYMDDCIVFHNDKEYLWELYSGMKKIAESLGLEFNENKTKIVKITKGFKFLKIHYRMEGNQIIRTLDHSTIVRQRRKLKKFKRLVDNGKMSYDDVYNSMQSWLSNLKYVNNSYYTKKSMLKLYDELFDGYKITKKYFKKNEANKCKTQNELLLKYKW